MDMSKVPGWEGSQGPYPKDYNKPHVYARCIHSGAGNCVCGRQPEEKMHVPVPSAPTGGWREMITYECGTCGGTTLVIRAIVDGWTLSCVNGHELVPVIGMEIVVSEKPLDSLT